MCLCGCDHCGNPRKEMEVEEYKPDKLSQALSDLIRISRELVKISLILEEEIMGPDPMGKE